MQIWWPIGWDMDSVIECLTEWLLEQGYEVNTERKGWRVMMFRKNSTAWTQGYTGLTHRAKAPRDRIRFAGPELAALEPAIMGFYEDGIFWDKWPLVSKDEQPQQEGA
jgi:hypothetical protein